MKGNTFILFTIAAVLGLWVGGCSKSSGSSDALTTASLNQIPDTGTMVAANSASISKAKSFTGLINSLDLKLNTATVVGTPGNVIDVLLSPTLVDTNFFNGLVATITTAGSATTDQANQFFGQKTGGPGGQGACQQAVSVAEIIGRTNGGTMCYMKGIATAPVGITIIGASGADIFSQAATDKLIKITLSGMTGRGEGSGMPSAVYMKVYGTNTMGANIYKVGIHMCSAANAVQESETITVDKTAGTFVNSQSGASGGSSTYGSSVTAYLKKSGDNIVFDSSKEREGSFYYSGSYGGQTNTSKGSVKMTYDATNGDIMHVKNVFSSSWGKNEIAAAAAYSGTKMNNVKFLQSAYQMQNTGTWGGSTKTNTVTAGAVFDTTYYKAIDNTDTTNPLLVEVKAVNFATDTFYTNLTAPTSDTSALNCTDTGDIQVTMDFSAAGVKAIRAGCDGDRENNGDGLYNACNSAKIQNVQNIARQAFYTAHH